MRLLGGSDERKTGEARERTIEESEEEEELTDEEIEKQIRKLKRKKATGTDGIPKEAWIDCEGNMRERLKELVRKVWAGNGFPKQWRKGVIAVLHKKGDTEDAGNYRGITLLSTAYKIYASVLNERLKKEVEGKGILPDTQAGFRENRGTIGNVYILQHVIERELTKKKVKVYALFVDLKAAFDSVKRKILWRSMEKCGIRRGLIDRTKEIYEETRNVVRSKEKESREFWTKEGLRQGCPLSPTLFTVFIADLEDELRKGQVGGMVVGKTKFWTLAYADDVALVAAREEELREMINRMEKYFDRKELNLNAKKTKVMIFRKGGGRERMLEWKWKGENMEVVKEFTYLGILFQRNRNMAGNVRERVKRANVLLNQVWGIGERKFKNDFRLRMYMFDMLVVSILMYGAELWGWRERVEVERVQTKYIKWALGLDRCTPNYIVLEETKREKIRVRTGQRAMKYEEEAKKKEGRNLLKECIKEKEEGRIVTPTSKEREGYLKRNGVSQLGIEQLRREGQEIVGKLRERDKENQKQVQYNEIEKTKYNIRYKCIRTGMLAEYLSRIGNENSQSLLARARCGNTEKRNRYWEGEEARRCDFCKDGWGTFEHMVRDCSELETGNIRVEDIDSGRKSEEVIKWLRKVEKKRKDRKRT